MSNPYIELLHAIAPITAAFAQYSHSGQVKNSTEPVFLDVKLDPDLQPDNPLANLCSVLHLNNPQRDLLLLCLTLELFPKYQAISASLQGKAQAIHLTYALAQAVLASFNWSLLNPSNPLTYWQILTPDPKRGVMEAPLRLDPYIFSYLLGEAELDPQLNPHLQPVPHCDGAIQQLPNIQAALQQAQILQFPSQGSEAPHLLLQGQDPHSRRHLAAALSETLHRPLYRLSLSHLPLDSTKLQQLRRCWDRQALLTQSLLLLELDARVPDDRAQTQSLEAFIHHCRSPLILSHTEALTAPERLIDTIELSPLTTSDRHQLWQQHLGNRAAALSDLLPQIAEQFPLTPQRIATLAGQLPITERPADLAPQLWATCRQAARPQLQDLAQRITTPLTWQDLVLPPKQTQRLQELVAAVRQRTVVYQDWGFAQKEDRGLGILALFAGESGTGKTTAAELIAKELELDCYRIDLSNIVNKYIGETEKNLKRVFDAAEGSGAMLLFDEADAVFGMRGEVKEARDRYANQEVSYLLQRLETFPGIAILTTNLKASIDEAFQRRLRYVIDFPKPEERDRLVMWQRVFPESTPLGELNYAQLAKVNLTGGNIRNIALTAAFLAAEAGEPIAMTMLIEAIEVELEKVGRRLTGPESQALKGGKPYPPLR